MDHIADRTDHALESAVETALERLSPLEPHIGVAADHGTVTLRGGVLTETDMRAVLAAALGVEGVHAIANEIDVRSSLLTVESGTEVAIVAV